MRMPIGKGRIHCSLYLTVRATTGSDQPNRREQRGRAPDLQHAPDALHDHQSWEQKLRQQNQA